MVVAHAAQKRCLEHTSSSASLSCVELQSQMVPSGLYRSLWFGIQSMPGKRHGWQIWDLPMGPSEMHPKSATTWKARCE
eukprot:5658342-Amphidinium_carterae.1